LSILNANGNRVPPSLWSLYGRSYTTNNVSEGFNNKLKNKFGRRRNNFTTFFIKLKSYLHELSIDLIRAQNNAERPVRRKLRDIKKSRLINECFNTINETGVLVFLYKVAVIRSSENKLKCVNVDNFNSFFNLSLNNNDFTVELPQENLSQIQVSDTSLPLDTVGNISRAFPFRI